MRSHTRGHTSLTSLQATAGCRDDSINNLEGSRSVAFGFGLQQGLVLLVFGLPVPRSVIPRRIRVKWVLIHVRLSYVTRDSYVIVR